MYGTSRSIPVTATGTLDEGSGYVLSAHLAGAAAAATMVLRSGGSGGTIICSLAAGVNGGDERTFVCGVPYTNLHVTVSGAAMAGDVEVG